MSVSPNRSSSASVRSRTSSSGRWRSRRPWATSSKTVCAMNWCSGFWKTKPIRDESVRESLRPTSRSPTRTVPRGGGMTPAIAWMRVVLPAPLAPTTATNSPAATVEVDVVQDGGPAAAEREAAHLDERSRAVLGSIGRAPLGVDRSIGRGPRTVADERCVGGRRRPGAGSASSAACSSAGVSGSGSSAKPARRSRSAASAETGSHTPIAWSSSARRAQHIVDGAVGGEAALLVEHDDAVDEADGRIEVVLDEQDRLVALGDQLGERVVDLLDAARVEVRGGLVEHEQGRSHRERARDRETLASAAREPIGVLAPPLPQADAAQRGLGAGEHLGHRHPQILGTEGDLVEQRARSPAAHRGPGRPCPRGC